ncbi:MAG TPA: lytic murein transglycosylase [Solirubrobacteraceae bacterium]|nr:lytic murein transglycosylase [Solirubrobacteraceae bacterium]
MSGSRRVSSRRRAWRTALSALAGGGLTAAGLGGPLAAALGAEAPTGSTTSTAGAPTPVATTPQSTVETAAQATGTSTQSTTAQPAGGSAAAGAPPSAPGEAPTIVVRRKQHATASKPTGRSVTRTTARSGGKSSKGAAAGGASAPAGGPNNVALPPLAVAGQAGALAAMLGSSAVSAQALDFYRIPLFLLPIYRAAAVQYDVPWQILAAINEIETNYGTDLSVSSAGAVGWMQFMPSTWLQYGVDALNAGYADPYNPVDAIFAAARYLNAAGATQNLNAAILAYNHSEAYVSSVLLRAKLIAAYPGQVIATLTGLIDDRLPVTGRRFGWGAPAAAGVQLPSPSSATAGATPGSSAAPAPATAASAATATGAALQLVDVTSEPNADAVAVQDGRVVKLGSSRKLGRYVVLQDVYGDVFTYAQLGSIAPSYLPPRSESAAGSSAQSPGASTRGVSDSAGGAGASGSAPAGTGKLRVFAHPGNPDALAAARANAATTRSATSAWRPLRSGSIVAQGTVLGRVSTPAGARVGHLRFAIKPAGDPSTVDPRAILENWKQLDIALHPQGAKGNQSLLGATASDVFLLSKSRLEREVLSDPGIAMSACSRREVAAGAIDERVLATLAFLSRSGLKPAVGTLSCGNGAYAAAGYVSARGTGDAIAIVAINGVPIAGHQGAGSITDTTIRTLLTLQGQHFPARIVSLMRYPGAPTTLARADHGDYVEVVFAPAPTHASHVSPAAIVPAAHAAGAGATAPAPEAIVGGLSATQWEQLISRVAGLPVPKVTVKPSSAAIPDPKGARVAGGGKG